MRPLIQARLINGPFDDPGLYVEEMFARRALLFDLGDIAALPPRKLLRVGHVFVSHTHMDHFAGFDRLLRVLLGRDKTLALYGPPGFIGKVEHKLAAYTWNLVPSYPGNLVLEVSEVGDADGLQVASFASRRSFQREDLPPRLPAGGFLLDQDGLRVRATLLDHDTPCLAFALEEAVHINIWRPRLQAMGLVTGAWLRDFKRAIRENAGDETPIPVARLADGAVVAGTMPLGALRQVASVAPGQKIAYVVDARYHAANIDRVVALAAGADVLFIEAGFLAADAAHAARKNHLTALQAGDLARRAGVRRAVPFHFSTRYRGREQAIRAEVEQGFRGRQASSE